VTNFEYDNLPDEMTVDALGDELFFTGLAALASAAGSGHTFAKEIKIAHVYNRKGYMALDTFGGHRNTAYSSVDDDIVLQVTVRVQHPSQVDGALDSLQRLENLVRAQNEEAERIRMEAELVQADEEMLKAAANAREKRAQLEKLRGAGGPR
jgi:hypothetical protein